MRLNKLIAVYCIFYEEKRRINQGERATVNNVKVLNLKLGANEPKVKLIKQFQ